MWHQRRHRLRLWYCWVQGSFFFFQMVIYGVDNNVSRIAHVPATAEALCEHVWRKDPAWCGIRPPLLLQLASSARAAPRVDNQILLLLSDAVPLGCVGCQG